MNTIPATVRVTVYIETYEPGNHISRRKIGSKVDAVIDLPGSHCTETRPDWGCYSPVITFPAIERALRTLGLLSRLADPQKGYSYSTEYFDAKGASFCAQ
jgi:hypothetical protein